MVIPWKNQNSTDEFRAAYTQLARAVKCQSEARALYVDTQEKFEELLDVISTAEVLAIDTEFIHDKTYYPRLCLIQIATENCEAIIDPFAPLQLELFSKVLSDENIMKVFHAGDQDRQILYRLTQSPVRPIFDLQYAVMLLGQSQQMSLARIVRLYCDIELEKGESFSDWSYRPLSESQIKYAIDDVRYLPSIYQKIVQELASCGRLEWLQEDFAAMENESSFETEDDDRWKKLKGLTSLKAQQLAIARELCSWRERVSRKRDLPRKWMLPDEIIVQICKNAPDNLEELVKIRGVKRYLKIKQLREILELIDCGKNMPQITWPKHEPVFRQDFHITAKIDMMNALIHLRSKELQIASIYLAKQEDLMRLALGERNELEVLSGWRAEFIGNELIRLLNGELSLSLSGDDLKVTLTEQSVADTAH